MELTIPESLVEKKTATLTNPLKHSTPHTETFDLTHTDGIFEVWPASLTFAGFQGQQVQTRKLTVRNVSQLSQRVSVLPTNTTYFKLRYNKKGMLAPGMSEVIYVQFTPPEWRYYFDCVRLLSPGQNLNVPIHAYPALNAQERYVPSFVDLGKCEVGHTLKKPLCLECTVPVDFEYEFRTLKAHPDIRIDPKSGEIPGNSKRILDIVFEPRSATTAEAIFEFRLSEFDYVPVQMKVFGLGKHFQPDFVANLVFSPTKVLRTPRRMPRKLPRLKAVRSLSMTDASLLEKIRKKPAQVIPDPIERGFALRRNLLVRFENAVKKVSLRIRMERVLIRLKRALEGVRTKQQAARFVIEENRQSELKNAHDSEPVSFSFKAQELQASLFPEEFGAHQDEYQDLYTIEPAEAYSDFRELPQIDQQDFELADYSDVAVPCTCLYLPTYSHLERRAGAEQEYSSVLPKGENKDLEVLQAPKNSLKPAYVEPLAGVLPHPQFRIYMRISGISENTPAYKLRLRQLARSSGQDSFDPRREYQLRNWRPHAGALQVQVAEDLKKAVELLSDSDSDSDNLFSLEATRLEEYIKNFEDEVGDATEEPMRRRAEQDWSEGVDNEKKLARSWMPSQIYRANRAIVMPAKKLAIV